MTELGQPYTDPTKPHEFERSTEPGRCNVCYGKITDARHIVVTTEAYQARHGKAPRGRASWAFVTGTPDKPCEREEAHRAHMAVNGECPWCGSARLIFPNTTYSEARRRMNGAGPGTWTLEP